MKEFWKSVNIWGSYGHEFSVLFFLIHGVQNQHKNKTRSYVRLRENGSILLIPYVAWLLFLLWDWRVWTTENQSSLVLVLSCDMWPLSQSIVFALRKIRVQAYYFYYVSLLRGRLNTRTSACLTLLAFAAERRPCSNRSISPGPEQQTRRSGMQWPNDERGGTDRQTNYVYFKFS